ncbi:MAG: outer membrane protein transport protein [Pseudomonadales bacterium]|nr:outer membrane protein transport protein [Pseudomonadales bacterium]
MHKTMIRRVVLFFLVVASAQSHGQLFQNLLIGNAKALALGQAVTADPPGIDSIHFNPAGLTRLKGRQVEIKVLAADFSLIGEFELNNPDIIKRYDELEIVDPIAGRESDVDGLAVYLPGGGFTEVPIPLAPLGGVSFNRKGSKWTFANSVYAPMAFGLSRGDDNPGKVYGRALALSRITFFSPSFGYQVTENFSVGMTATFSFTGFAADFAYRASGGVIRELAELLNQTCGRTDRTGFVLEVPFINACGGELSAFESLFDFRADMKKNVSTTINIGLLWDATDWLTLGMVYQTEAVDYLKGTVDIQIYEGLLGLLNGLAENEPLKTILVDAAHMPEDGHLVESGSIKLVTPQHLSFGMSMQVLPKLKFNVDVKWTETSEWEQLDFQTDQNVGLFALFTILQVHGAEPDHLTVPRGYVDTVNWGFGLEYQYDAKTAIRFGYEPRKTGIPDDKRDFTVPLADLDVYAVGFSRNLSKTSSFDLTIATTSSDMYIPSGSSTNGNDHTNINNFIYHPTSGLDTRSSLSIFLVETSYRKHF